MDLFGHLFAPEDRGPCLVSIEGDRVASIRPMVTAPAGSLGGPATRILPGLIDAQLNGAFGVDFSELDADVGLARRRLPESGVTAFVPTLVTSPLEAYPALLANLRPGPGAGAQVLGAHVEGPFISPQRPGAHDPSRLRTPDPTVVDAWLAAGDLRIVTLAPELPGADACIRRLAQHGVVVSMGHSDATWDEARAGADAGIRFGTHIFNAMRPLRHRDPGLVGFLLASHLPVGFMADGNHLDFGTIRMLFRCKAPDELVLVTDGLAGLGMPPGPYVVAGHSYISDGTAGRLPDGTLSGSLLPLNRALRNLVEAVGISPETAVRTATLNPARLLGLEEAHGRVEVGRPADVVLVDQDWEPLLTLIAGRAAAGPLATEVP